MAKFAVGDRVGLLNGKLTYSEYGDEPCYGVIVAELTEDSVMIKWDDSWKNTNNRPVNTDKLVVESELKAKYSALEAEFQRVEAEVKGHMEQASKLILAAQSFAKAAGFDLQELREATGTLESAMEEAGWNTSSWHC
jgi:hypothetical protein